MEVAKSLSARANNFIQWPRGQEILDNESEFEEIAHFPNVIGLIDGCHIQINAPHQYPENYINRHGYTSINVQGICNARRMFIDVYATCCGSINDARVWNLSDIKKETCRNYEEYFPNDTYMLGDKIYPVLRNLLPPYRNYGNLSREETYFNKVHVETRQIIERTFALLVGRFRRLKYVYVQKVEYAPLIILACCCLHNICISLNDLIEEEAVANVYDNDADDNDVPHANLQLNANIKRDNITRQLYLNRQR